MQEMTECCPCCNQSITLQCNDSYDWDVEWRKLVGGILKKWNNRRSQKRKLKELSQEMR